MSTTTIKKESKTVRRQKQEHRKNFIENGVECRIVLTIRYDDECKNGKNTFAMTGDIYENGRHTQGGCIHEEIAKHFPEFKHLIKWHLMDASSPMYYIENTMYHARDRSHEGKEIGEPVSFKEELKFNGFPFTFKEKEKGFFNYLKETKDFSKVEVLEVPYDGKDRYDFTPKYTLSGFTSSNPSSSGKWYKCPFDNKVEANQFLEALRNNGFEIVKIPTGWCEAVTPNLNAARSCAIWENATLKQLQDKEALKARLPKLMEEFINDIEKIGLEY